VSDAPLKVAVLVSGRGSNLQSLIDACATPGFPARIVTVISNEPDALAVERAKFVHIPTMIVEHRKFPSRDAFEAALDAALKDAGAEFICLAGFMRVLGADFMRRWEGRMINIHPSLLPAFKGLHVHEQALEAGVRVSGCTVHYVVPDLDAGPIIAQAAVPVEPGDTPESLAVRVLKEEHRLYPETLRRIAEGRVMLEDNRVVFRS
jgi:phosphoribosylglycinamide formyltransferase-1